MSERGWIVDCYIALLCTGGALCGFGVRGLIDEPAQTVERPYLKCGSQPPIHVENWTYEDGKWTYVVRGKEGLEVFMTNGVCTIADKED